MNIAVVIYLMTFTNNNKHFWFLIERLWNKFQPVASLNHNDELRTSPLSKAEALNDQFYSVFIRDN